MTPLMRWLRFNCVGAMGFVVQLALLAAFNRLWHGRYLLASTVALEITLLHNFVWHVRFTWRDCRGCCSLWKRLLQFHVSNGAVSLAGNLAIMQLLVVRLHMPAVPTNAIAVLLCSLVNFRLGDRWIFREEQKSVAPQWHAPAEESHGEKLVLRFANDRGRDGKERST